jgi:homoserine/homoserine lactone efflux protein
MSLEAWTVFALFWVVFVATPGPNAVNCIQNGMTLGFRRSVPGILAILTQATLFLTLSALGVTALIAAHETAFTVMRYSGAAVLIWLGIRGWRNAGRVIRPDAIARPVAAYSARATYLRAFAIATINPKSVAGYVAAFSQFVQPDVPIGQQMWVIMPTALTIGTAIYCTYTMLGVIMGRAALGAVFNMWFRRGMALCFIAYGLALGLYGAPNRGAV